MLKAQQYPSTCRIRDAEPLSVPTRLFYITRIGAGAVSGGGILYGSPSNSVLSPCANHNWPYPIGVGCFA